MFRNILVSRGGDRVGLSWKDIIRRRKRRMIKRSRKRRARKDKQQFT